MVKLDTQETLLLREFNKANSELHKGHYIHAFVIYQQSKPNLFLPLIQCFNFVEIGKIGRMLGRQSQSFHRILFYQLQSFKEIAQHLWKKEKYPSVKKLLLEILRFCESVIIIGAYFKLRIYKAKLFRMLGMVQR